MSGDDIADSSPLKGLPRLDLGLGVSFEMAQQDGQSLRQWLIALTPYSQPRPLTLTFQPFFPDSCTSAGFYDCPPAPRVGSPFNTHPGKPLSLNFLVVSLTHPW